ncbi:ABC transporter permease [bacterium]|nr:ABC transporter permease [bacterium]
MIKNYFKIALRNILKHRLHSSINILGLAIGLACCLLIMLWVRDELSYDRFNDNALRIFRLVVLDREDPNKGIAKIPGPWRETLTREFPEIENAARLIYKDRFFVNYQDKSFFEDGILFADPSVFNVFSFQWLNGDQAHALEQPNSVVITQSIAQKYFGDENPLGKSLKFGQQDLYQVTGVMQDVPSASHLEFSCLVSMSSFNPWFMNDWQMTNYYTYVLLKEGADPRPLEEKIERYAQTHLDQTKQIKYRFQFQPLMSIHLHSKLARELSVNSDITYVYVFSAVALFILLIAGFNFINLSTARSLQRAKEVGIRKTVGANRRQLIRQFLGESIVTSVLASLLALGMAEMAMPFFNELTQKNIHLGWNHPFELLTWIGFTLFIGIASGIYPALMLSSFQPIQALKDKVNVSSKSFLRQSLVTVQFTICIALLICSLAIVKQLQFIQTKNLGFNKDQVVVLSMLNDKNIKEHSETIKTALKKCVGVAGVALTSGRLGGGDWGMPMNYEGASPGEQLATRVLMIDEDYIPTMQMQMVQGRNLSEHMATDGEGFLINESALERLHWVNPIGKYLERPIERGKDGQWKYKRGTVIGVVKDFNFRSLHQKIEPLVMYMQPENNNYFFIKIMGSDIPAAVQSIEKVWKQFAPETPMEFHFMDELFDRLYHAEDRLGKIIGFFSFLGIAIGCLGLYGLVSYVTVQRHKEIGIRKVLGASVASIITLLSKEFLKWVLVANFIAWPVAYYFMNTWLENYAYKVDLTFGVFVLSGAAAMAIALLTVSFQAGRAAAANPVEALKYE